MNIRILKENDLEVEILIEGETHTILNMIKSELLKNNKIEIAYYDIKNLKNSLSKSPILYLKTYKKENKKEILKNAIKNINDKLCNFSDLFKKSTIEYKNNKMS